MRNSFQQKGIVIRGIAPSHVSESTRALLGVLNAQDLALQVQAYAGSDAQGDWLAVWLEPAMVAQWAPGLDTLSLAKTLQLDIVNNEAHLVREIVVTMLMGPVAFEFPSLDELVSAVHIRRNIVQAARKTTLAFHTSEADRPEDCWAYDEDHGFVIKPGASLIDAITKATQPEVSGSLYSFSCYRATEYVIVLGIALELARCNPPLYQQLQTLWEQRPIRSGEFHDVFLREQGSMEEPLPPRYYVPGDRTWFRNPDGASAEASGFEGSWVMYMGGGLFTNFWKRDQPYTLEQKSLEIYHWRHGLYFDAEGEERIDESKVEVLVEETLRNPAEVARISALMGRYREARGIYTDAGGCIDTTREFARWVRPGSADMVLPVP